ncbi:hypothetical protein [Bacillus sp. 165]|uniref:hypothetical protein n=1 Tax=Bacillus sp. 165 TaxID=1529117 RepID=UPI001AD9F28F|nr:hypothetical protein [Bacillus sp. 165]MBO9129453.1 hypothetical protein [Bacillus sp. 165]
MKTLCKMILAFFLIFSLLPVQNSSAHSCTAYGETYGYWIDCSNHQAGKYFSYNTASGMSSLYQTFVTGGVGKWNSTGVVSISRSSSYSINGYVHTYTDSNTSIVAAFYNYVSNGSGHLTQWSIKMNTAIMDGRTGAKNQETMAHEMGHAIGLNDLYLSGNQGVLMYGYSDRTATSPTSKDQTGAAKAVGN